MKINKYNVPNVNQLSGESFMALSKTLRNVILVGLVPFALGACERAMDDDATVQLPTVEAPANNNTISHGNSDFNGINPSVRMNEIQGTFSGCQDGVAKNFHVNLDFYSQGIQATQYQAILTMTRDFFANNDLGVDESPVEALQNYFSTPDVVDTLISQQQVSAVVVESASGVSRDQVCTAPTTP